MKELKVLIDKMARILKFRAWHTIWKKMAWLDHIWDNSWYTEPIKKGEKISCAEMFHNRNSSELTRGIYYNQIITMQFTELKDKEGVEIYEGDIAILDNVPEEDNPMVMMWNPDGRFNFVPIKELKEFPKRSGYYCPSYNCKIIGNVYENPELLEVKNGN